MAVTSLSVSLMAIVLLVLVPSATACSCGPRSFPVQYRAAVNAGTPLSLATVLRSFTRSNIPLNGDRFYVLRVTKVFGRCKRRTRFVTVARTKVQGSLCGVSLQTGKTYLLPIRRSGGTRLVLCNVNILRSSLTRVQQRFLRRIRRC